jgi:hypothetical protein
VAVGTGSSSTIGARSGSGDVVTVEASTVLAGKGEELVTLGALGDLDSVLVSPLFDLAVRPRVKKSIAEARLGSGGRRRDGRISALEVQAGLARVSADSSNQLVAGRGLGNIVATLIEPGLEVRVGPRRVEPITRVRSGLGDLVGSRLIVLTDNLEERIALTGLGDWNAVLVGEGLELGVGPAMVR